jgi:hypothetical protein
MRIPRLATILVLLTLLLGGLLTVTPPHVRADGGTTGEACFQETGFCVRGRFLDYWTTNGGLARNGFPLSDERQELLEDGNTYTVQYFERVRLELHPENAAPYDVLLGQFGRRILTDNALLATDGGFQRLYFANALWAVLGRPAGPVERAAGAYQGFQGGAMLYRADRRQIVALCSADQQMGFVFAGGTDQAPSPFLPDTWAEGQDPGGAPGPQPGLSAPRRGFGKLWRERDDIRRCLGYATTPEEASYTIRVQQFARGYLVSAATPTGNFIYLLSVPARGGTISFSRYPDPMP